MKQSNLHLTISIVYYLHLIVQSSVYCRSSHRRCSVKKGFLKNFAKFTRKHLCWSLFLNKVAGLSPATLLKKRLQQRCSMNFTKFLKPPFLHQVTDCFHYLQVWLNLTNFFKMWNSRKWIFPNIVLYINDSFK